MYLYKEKPFGLAHGVRCRAEVTHFCRSNQTYTVLQTSVRISELTPFSTVQSQRSFDSSLQSQGAGTGTQVSPVPKPPTHHTPLQFQSQQKQTDQDT